MTEPTYEAIESRTAFHDALRAALVGAVETGVAEMFFVDPHFADWPLNEPGVVASLAAWAGARRKLVVFASDFAPMARTQLRFVAWRRLWSHVVQCRTDDDVEPDAVPTLLLVPGRVCVRLLDRQRHRGIVSAKPIDLVEGREAIDALLQRSTETFPVTPLGL